MLRTPAPHWTVLLETPETVAIAMQSAQSMGAPWLVETYLEGLHAALEAAVRTVPATWRCTHAEMHLAPLHDASIPQPHAHLAVAGVGDAAAARRWAIEAHTAFQAALRGSVPGMRTVDQPTGCGWDIATLLPRRGTIGRHRCLPPSATVVYPADLVTTRADHPTRRTA